MVMGDEEGAMIGNVGMLIDAITLHGSHGRVRPGLTGAHLRFRLSMEAGP